MVFEADYSLNFIILSYTRFYWASNWALSRRRSLSLVLGLSICIFSFSIFFFLVVRYSSIGVAFRPMEVDLSELSFSIDYKCIKSSSSLSRNSLLFGSCCLDFCSTKVLRRVLTSVSWAWRANFSRCSSKISCLTSLISAFNPSSCVLVTC